MKERGWIPVKHRTLPEEVERVGDMLSTASGTAELALEGSKDALSTWACLVGEFLVSQADQPGALSGFPEGFEDVDARDCLYKMAAALEQIHAGVEPNRALGWNRGRRGRPSAVITSTVAAYENDARLVEVEVQIEKHGLSVDVACEQVAQHYGDSTERLLGLYRRSRRKKSRP